MRRPTLHLALSWAFIAAIAMSGTCGAAAVRTPHVEAELVADQTALVPGHPLMVALRLSMDRGWHSYWQNPGDSGLPTTLAWRLPSGVTAGPIQWPAPRVLRVGPLANYGYEGEVLLPAEIRVAPGFESGKPVTLSARADWLVCKEICIPEGADLSLSLPVVADAGLAQRDPRWGDAIAKTRTTIPRPLQGWNVSASGRGQVVDLVLTPKPGSPTADVGSLRFFPFVEGQIEASGRQTLARDGSTLTLSLPVATQRVGAFDRVAGVLTANPEIGGVPAVIVDAPLSGTVVAATASAPRAGSALASPVGPAQSSLSLGVAIGFAFLGGLLLNLMPCVFPVLSLKVLGFAKAGESRASMRRHGVAFAVGIIVSFWLLAAVLVALRAAGEQLGWGFQLQSPAMVAVLALLFFVLALNLSGVFEVRQLVPSGIATWNAKNPVLNDVLSGGLAVLIASPCSAPFMGAALGYALIEAPVSTGLIFTALGAGMALPYLALAFFPRWRERLPRPGAWMARLKQLLAFPLYATVLWLLWVLGAQLDNDAVARLGATLLLVAFALWAWQTMRTGGRRVWGIAAAAGVAAALAVAWPVVVASMSEEMPLTAKPVAGDSSWQEFSPERVSQLVGAGRTVFVEFTAAWCVTCQVNKRLVLNSDAVRDAFARRNVALVRADWTRRDPMIGAALAGLGRDGVPVYVLYSRGKEPRLLPEVLRRQDIIDALGTLRTDAPPSVASQKEIS